VEEHKRLLFLIRETMKDRGLGAGPALALCARERLPDALDPLRLL
jgi:hypothetical protein